MIFLNGIRDHRIFRYLIPFRCGLDMIENTIRIMQILLCIKGNFYMSLISMSITCIYRTLLFGCLLDMTTVDIPRGGGACRSMTFFAICDTLHLNSRMLYIELGTHFMCLFQRIFRIVSLRNEPNTKQINSRQFFTVIKTTTTTTTSKKHSNVQTRMIVFTNPHVACE